VRPHFFPIITLKPALSPGLAPLFRKSSIGVAGCRFNGAQQCLDKQLFGHVN